MSAPDRADEQGEGGVAGNRSETRPKLLYVVTHPMTARYLLRGQLAFMAAEGFDVTVVASPGDDLDAVEKREGVRVMRLPMRREVRPLHDLLALVRLWRQIHRLAPQVVNAGTPKAGLLGMIASWLAGVPVRIYTLRGLRLETARGAQRRLLGLTERLASALAHSIVCVSPSLARRYLELGLAPPEKVRVLGDGSSNGVAVEDPESEATLEAEARRLRGSLGLPTDASVVGFVGRLNRAKGVGELLQAMQRLWRDDPDIRLLLVGGREEGEALAAADCELLRHDPRCVITGFVSDPRPYYRLMDVLAFPSFREGFPNAPLEAAAARLPVVGFAVTGTVDAVVDGVTGRLVAAGDWERLASGLAIYLGDSQLRRLDGEAAYERARSLYDNRRVWSAVKDEYRRLLAAANPRLTTPAVPSSDRHRRYDTLKRALDVIGALAGLVLASPLLLALAALIRLNLGSPVLFRQQRPGRDGRPFVLYKFRTMRETVGADGEPAADAERLTALGRALRRWSLDELPELVNVLKGEMSLVGPRPLLMEYLGLYTAEQARRHEVRPGLTGWAQVNGRNAQSWEERFRLDVWYVEHRSLWLDLRIVWMTLFQVLGGRGVSAERHATMPRFKGSS